MLYPPSEQRKYLFTDYHNILCGDLEWSDREGNPLPLNNPPGPARPAVASRGLVPHGIRLEAQQARKTGPLSTDMYLASGLLYEDGMYRCWFGIGPTCESCGYAESSDGMTWKRPRVHKETTPSDPTGNAVFGPEWVPDRTRVSGFTVFKDPHGAPAEQYKMIHLSRPPRDRVARIFETYTKGSPLQRSNSIGQREYTADDLVCVYAAVSPDGLQWKPLPDPLFIHFIDTLNAVYYDQWFQRYVMYTREYSRQRRLISRVESEDFLHWGPVIPLIGVGTDERPTLDIYANGFTQYPGEPEIRLMFPQVYDRGNQTSHLRLSSSPDGYLWYEAPGGAVLSTGGPGEWDSEYLAVGTGLVPFGADRVGVLYEGAPYPHKYPRWPQTHPEAVRKTGWAWWPEGRLCAVRSDEEGEFHTFPMRPRGRTLKVNFTTRVGGCLRIGIAKHAGCGVDECDVLVGDAMHQAVSWKGRTQIDVKDSERVMLHVKMRSADLFAVEWE